MLAAYYDCSCDSHGLFDDKIIAQSQSYEKYLNGFNVIYLDISSFVSYIINHGGSLKFLPDDIELAIWNDLLECGFVPKDSDGDNLNAFLRRIVEGPDGKPFIFILDDWDAVIRTARGDHEAQRRYLNLLRGWFKNTTFTPQVVAAACMTGILPIRKDDTESGLSDFDEASMMDPMEFGEFLGFTEDEAEEQCRQRGVSFEEIRDWCPGYDLSASGPVYNPYCIHLALEHGRCQSYWSEMSGAESIEEYITMDLEGLQETVERLMAGERVRVYVESFQNDLESFDYTDDILTLLIHLGYVK